MTIRTDAQIKADFVETFTSNIAELKAAIEIAKIQPSQGFVFCWPAHWLGVRVNGHGCHAVRCDRATITHSADKREFTNGKGEVAVLMPLMEALEGALAESEQVWKTFKAHLT